MFSTNIGRMDIHDRLRERMKSERVDTAAQLHRLLCEAGVEISPATVKNWLTKVPGKRRPPSVRHLKPLAAALKTSPGWLLTGRDDDSGEILARLPDDERYVLLVYRQARALGVTPERVMLLIGSAVDRLPTEAAGVREDPPPPPPPARTPRPRYGT